MKLIKKQTGATALIEMLAAVALIGVLAVQAIPNTFEIREAGLNAVVVSQVMATRDAIEAEFAEASLADQDALYSHDIDLIKLYMPGGTEFTNAFDSAESEPDYDDGTGTLSAAADGDVRWTTSAAGDTVTDGYTVTGTGSDSTGVRTLIGGN